MIIPVILSGGSGTRLWPMSRKLYPKQFLALAGDATMFQKTVQRAAGLASPGVDVAAPVVVCNEEHRFLAAEQLRQIGVNPAAIILEPLGRNTAPAAAVAAMVTRGLEDYGPETYLLILPADHVIENDAAFAKAVATGLQAAGQGRLVTFGIAPQYAETGFGYIEQGQPLAGVDGAFAVSAFREKPDAGTAQEYVESGRFHWNSGIFLFQAEQYLRELQQHVPAMVQSCSMALEQAGQDLDFTRLDKESFASCVDDSIDYAVMERTSAAAVVPMDPGWSDVGSWRALWDIGQKNDEGNVFKGDVLAHDTEGTYVHAGSRMVATVGVRDLVIVETSDALLVAHKDRVQDVKHIVGQLARKERSEAVIHRKVYRPWGAYEGIDMGDGFQVKRITVNPGATLSLQMHHHRAEHWVVVRGTAVITKGDEDILLSEDQSTYIPLGTVHRLHNPGKIPLELIEVQTGNYLGEDDIVRLEDVYGRKEQKSRF